MKPDNKNTSNPAESQDAELPLADTKKIDNKNLNPKTNFKEEVMQPGPNGCSDIAVRED